MTLPDVLPWLALAISGGALFRSITRDATKDMQELRDRLTKVEIRLEPLLKLVTLDVPRLLHSPDPQQARLDHLLEKFMHEEPMSGSEESEFYRELMRLTDNEDVPPGRRFLAAAALRAVELKRLLNES